MSLHRVSCPECGAGLKSASGFQVGKTICCPKCETYFTVEEETEDSEENEERDNPKIEGDSPKKSAKGKKKRRRGGKDQERSYKNSPLRYAILGILVIALVAGLYFLIQKTRKQRQAETADSGPAPTQREPPKGQLLGPAGPPDRDPKPKKTPQVSAEEEQAIKGLEKLGAAVQRDGIGQVFAVDLSNKNLGKEVIPLLKPLSNLQSLILSYNQLTDAILDSTEGSWPNLIYLELDFTGVTDKGIAFLEKSAPKLNYLSLSDNPGVTDQGIESLSRLPLKRLHITGTSVTDLGLSHVKKFTDLEELYCGNRGITDNGVSELKELVNLRSLVLGDTRVTDKGLAHLSGLKKLEFLVLVRTRVTDAGMVHLQELKKLNRLRLSGTGVTRSGEETLKKAIPGLAIER